MYEIPAYLGMGIFREWKIHIDQRNIKARIILMTARKQ